MGNTYRILVGKRFGGQPLRTMRTHVEVNVMEMGSEIVRWTERAQDCSIGRLLC